MDDAARDERMRACSGSPTGPWRATRSATPPRAELEAAAARTRCDAAGGARCPADAVVEPAASPGHERHAARIDAAGLRVDRGVRRGIRAPVPLGDRRGHRCAARRRGRSGGRSDRAPNARRRIGSRRGRRRRARAERIMVARRRHGDAEDVRATRRSRPTCARADARRAHRARRLPTARHAARRGRAARRPPRRQRRRTARWWSSATPPRRRPALRDVMVLEGAPRRRRLPDRGLRSARRHRGAHGANHVRVRCRSPRADAAGRRVGDACQSCRDDLPPASAGASGRRAAPRPVGATEAAMDQAADDERLRRLQRLAFGAGASDDERDGRRVELIRLERAAATEARASGGRWSPTVPASPMRPPPATAADPRIRASGPAAMRRRGGRRSRRRRARSSGWPWPLARARSSWRISDSESSSVAVSAAPGLDAPGIPIGDTAGAAGSTTQRPPRRTCSKVAPRRQHRADGVPAAPDPPPTGRRSTIARLHGDAASLRCRDAARRLHRVGLHARTGSFPRGRTLGRGLRRGDLGLIRGAIQPNGVAEPVAGRLCLPARCRTSPADSAVLRVAPGEPLRARARGRSRAR